jgi:hypothetical protein
MTAVLQINAQSIRAEDITYVGDRLLELCVSPDERVKARKQLDWLNDTLTQLGLPHCCYPLVGTAQPGTS